MRTNCIDSLDRTNAAQYMVGKTMLAQMLTGLGVGGTATVGDVAEVDPDSDPSSSLHTLGGEMSVGADILLDMYEGLGNQIALQYGGSELANTMKTYVLLLIFLLLLFILSDWCVGIRNILCHLNLVICSMPFVGTIQILSRTQRSSIPSISSLALSCLLMNLLLCGTLKHISFYLFVLIEFGY